MDRANAIGEKLVQHEAATRLAAEAQQRDAVAQQASAHTERRVHKMLLLLLNMLRFPVKLIILRMTVK